MIVLLAMVVAMTVVAMVMIMVLKTIPVMVTAMGTIIIMMVTVHLTFCAIAITDKHLRRAVLLPPQQ